MNDLQPLIRILLRYAAMYLMTSGVISGATVEALMAPATLSALTGLIMAAGTEIWYRLARRGGGAT